MKSTILFGVALVFALASCDGEQKREKVAESPTPQRLLDEIRKRHAAEVAGLRSQLAEAREQLQEIEQLRMDLATARVDLANLNLRTVQAKAGAASASDFDAALTRLRATTRQSAQPNSTPPPNDQLQGLPGQVAENIRNKAAIQWPGDQRMAAYEQDNQAKAWRKMQGYENNAYGSIPYREKTSMLEGARQKWPDDWRMQVYEFEKQTSAWTTLEEWERIGIPGFTLTQSKSMIRLARQKWGQDYTMVLYEAKKGS